jgi:hypothetical protein
MSPDRTGVAVRHGQLPTVPVARPQARIPLSQISSLGSQTSGSAGTARSCSFLIARTEHRPSGGPTRLDYQRGFGDMQLLAGLK